MSEDGGVGRAAATSASGKDKGGVDTHDPLGLDAGRKEMEEMPVPVRRPGWHLKWT